MGINIARSGRVDSLALPTELILPILEELKTGKMMPSIVNKEKIERIDEELKALIVKNGELTESQNKLQMQFETQKAREEELSKMMKDIESRLAELKKSSEKSEEELKSLKAEMAKGEKTQERLESDRKRLATGIR